MTPISLRPCAATARLALAAAAIAALGGCATAPAIDWPAALEPAPDETWLATLAARGVQIYECRRDAAGASWVFVAPEAELFDAAGRRAGSHGAGPSWQAVDGSRVVGSVAARADAPAANAIPWLLLTTRSTGADGAFSRVATIRRANTAGGVSPNGGCDEARVGAAARVPYTADYLLYTRR